MNQIATSDVLNLSQHYGKAMKVVDINSTPLDPNQGFGFTSGKYVSELAAASGTSVTFTPNYAIRVSRVIAIAKGTPVAAENLTVSATDAAGLSRIMYVIDFSGAAREIARAVTYDASANFAGLSTTKGDTITVASAGGVTGGYQIILEFYNI